MKLRIRVAERVGITFTHGVFEVELSDEDVAHARQFDSVEGRAYWRLTQRMVEAGREIDLTAKPVFEILSTI